MKQIDIKEVMKDIYFMIIEAKFNRNQAVKALMDSYKISRKKAESYVDTWIGVESSLRN